MDDTSLFTSPEKHIAAIEAFQQALRSTQGSVRLGKRTSNLFRERNACATRLEASSFARTLLVDPGRGIAEVQGMCTFENFTDACLCRGCIPAVVPELKTITVGGAVSGIGIEASSFRYGLMHEAVEEIEVLCGDGEVRVCRPDNENAELFWAIPNSYGTLGYILRLRYHVVPARRSVHATYTQFSDRAKFLSALGKACDSSPDIIALDFVEGVCFDPAHYVLVTAVHSDENPNTTNVEAKPYYKNLQGKASAILATRDWMWRWDPDWFWCSRFYGMENPLVRAITGKWMLRSDRYWKIRSWYLRHGIERKLQKLRQLLGLKVELREAVVQDVEIPLARCSEFLDFYELNIGIKPLWICPIRPAENGNRWTLYPMPSGLLHLNFGFWESVPTTERNAPGHYNRLLEQEVMRLDGRKSLYSNSFYPEDEFWKIYNGDAYRALKNRYDPTHRFPNLYQKTVLRK